jgi:hypothetical protein
MYLVGLRPLSLAADIDREWAVQHHQHRYHHSLKLPLVLFQPASDSEPVTVPALASGPGLAAERPVSAWQLCWLSCDDVDTRQLAVG